MRLALICAVLSGCYSDGTGTVVYSEGGTGHIMTIDVATGTTTPIDLGSFGNVAIAADGQHVAYMGEDNLPKVSDLLGQVRELPPTNGCNAPLVWGPGNTLVYCTVDTFNPAPAFALMSGIGGPVRTIVANSIALSSDGTRVAYLSVPNPNQGSMGDLVVEDAGGANRRVLMGSVEVDRLAFLPDDSGLVISEIAEVNQFVEHVAKVSFADGTTTDLGEGFLVEPLPHGARFSPDGTEVLALTATELVALDLAGGAARGFARAGNNITIAGAAFLDGDRIVYSRQDSFFMGDVGGQTASVRFADGTDKVTLVSSDGSSQCQVTDIAATAGQVELVCAVPAIVDFDGNIIASRNAQSALGISADHQGMVTVDNLGNVEYVSDDGNVKALAASNTSVSAPLLVGPYAAYAP